MMARKQTPLNEKHRRILAFIDDYTAENGFPPSIRDIKEATGISSTSVVKYHLDRLVREGLIEQEAGISRGLRLTDRAFEFLGRARGGLKRLADTLDELVSVPIAGPVAAGIPIQPLDQLDPELDTVDIPRSMLPRNFKSGEFFALEVKGDSMIDALVYDGDIVILRRMEGRPHNGEMVAVWLNDRNETTLKYFYLDERTGRVRLQPANPMLQPIYIDDPSTVEVRGRVVMVIRQMEHPLAA